MCREALGIEPTAEQLEQAADITDDIARQQNGLFMYGWELNKQTMRIVAEANGIPPSKYEIKPEKKRTKNSRR